MQDSCYALVLLLSLLKNKKYSPPLHLQGLLHTSVGVSAEIIEEIKMIPPP